MSRDRDDFKSNLKKTFGRFFQNFRPPETAESSACVCSRDGFSKSISDTDTGPEAWQVKIASESVTLNMLLQDGWQPFAVTGRRDRERIWLRRSQPS